MFDFIKPSFWFNKRESELGAETVRVEQMGRFNALFHLDPDKIVSAVTQYKAGTLGPLARIIDDFEDRDDKMKTCSMKMKASAARCDYSVLIAEGYENDPRAKRHQEILKRFWSTVRATDRFRMNERGGIRLLKKQMMEAQSFGYAVHELVWTPLPNGEIAAEFIKLPLWHFENRTGELRFIPTSTGYDGLPMPEGKWMVTTGDGVGIAASIVAMAKHLAWQDWLLFSERCGIPILHAATGATKGSDAWNGIVAAVRRAARDFRMVTDANTKLAAIETGHSANIPYPELVDHADRAIAALYRGADLSTISKGDGTGASLQGDETGMLEQDACANLGETLHEQVDRFVIRYVTGDDTPLARISIDPVEKPDVDTDIKIDEHLSSHGVRLSKTDMLQRYGRAEAKSDDDAIEPTPKQPGGLGGFGGLPNEKQPDHRPDAASLVSRLPSLLPDDLATAAVIAEAMASAFGTTELANEIANPCPKCHRNMPKGGTCSFCAKRAANHSAGKSAFDEVAKTHKDKVGAMERDSIGKIDFIWGDDTEGICHILGKHKGSANQIPGVLAYGDVYESKTENKFYVIKKRYVAVLRKRTGSNHYLITGFKAESPDYASKIRKECDLVESGE